MRIPPNLRINADDFGLSPSISRAIVSAASRGLINSVSVVPFDDDESAHLLTLLASMPGVRIGAHLTFIEVPLLTRPPAFTDGIPPANYRTFLTTFLSGRVHIQDVRHEWSAQLDLLGSRIGAGRIHHLDSHQHIHALPGLWSVAQTLQRELAIPVLRTPYERGHRPWLKQFPMGAGLQGLAWVRARGASEHFYGVGTSMAFSAQRYVKLQRTLARDHVGRYELMVHPDEDARGQRELDELSRWLDGVSAKPAN